MPSSDDIVARLSALLLPEAPAHPHAKDLVPEFGPIRRYDRPPTPAAVLIALIRRPEGHTILYTERSPDLRAHSGQVAFPGGKVDKEDANAAAAALREANEEVGLEPADARLLGFMPAYYTGSNYLITPVVAEVVPKGPFVPNPGEVHSVFEVPLMRILDAQTYGRYHVTWEGEEHSTWQIDHDGHVIWGITGNLTRLLRDRIVNGVAA